jgi:hypothetical protein
MADSANRIVSNVWTAATGWEGWKAVGLPTAISPPGSPISGVSRRKDVLDVFWADELGRTMTAVCDTTSGWVVIGNVENGRTLPGGYVTAVSRAADVLDIFSVDVSGALRRAHWEPATLWQGWIPMSANGVPGAAVSPASRAAANIDVFYGSLAGGGPERLRIDSIAFDVPRGWLPAIVPNASTWALDPRARLRRLA